MKSLKCFLTFCLSVVLVFGSISFSGKAYAISEYGDATYINDSETSVISYIGTWQYYNSRGVGDYSNDVHATIYNNDYFEYSFYGTGIEVITEKDSCLGNVDIYIDNVFQSTVNCYNATLLTQQNIYSKTGLALGTHTVKVVKKSGTYMILDAVKFYPAGSTYINDNPTYQIAYTGSWGYYGNRGVGDYGSDVHATIYNGDYFEYTFTGTGIDYISEKDNCLGNVDIYIDNVFQKTVNCYNPSLIPRQTVYSKTGLAFRTHTIKGVKRSGTYMILDALKVYYDAASLYDDYNGSIVYSNGAFSSSYSVSGCLNSSVHWTTTAGSYAELSFTGSSISYIGSKNTDHGYVDIYIDDVYVSTIDTYAASRQWQCVLFNKTWTSPGAHKIKVVCKNQKNSSSTSIGFDLDAFKYTYDPEEVAMKPLWQGNTMHNESLLMVSSGGALAEAPLLFSPTRIISIRNARLDTEYVQGLDWTLVNGRIRLTPNSRIPYLTEAELYPSSQSQYTMPKTGGGYILYRENSYFHDKQIVVTYDHSPNAWTGPVPVFAGGSRLPNTMNLLNNQSNLKLVLYGDSISVGANSSWFENVIPFSPIWGKLAARELEKAYGSNITFVNPSVGGMTSEWGRNNAASLVAGQAPDLVILAFGMNDGTAVNAIQPGVFKSNIASIIDTVRASKPQAEFILVGTTLANQEAANFEYLQPQYMSVLNELAAEKTGVVTANMTGVHQTLLQYKNFRDMTGNNINHPNDFLVRWYAQFIKGMLVQ